ncbi:Metal ABC transporter permease [Candidatus Roizmanbacteria bacterium]|nr:Metal ABC transporter permease [Candidatus Roizmanbacteria bacterium]
MEAVLSLFFIHTNMFDIFQYGFILRGLEAGLIIAVIAPLIGIFLVLRRYSLIADTLSHVSLAGIALGLLLKINPIITALIASISSSIFIEKLRINKKVYGESALSIFLSGSLAIAIVLIGIAKGFNINLFNYLFGSIVTVKQIDVYLIGILGMVVIGLIIFFYKELVYVTFDEESAKVSGINTNFINTLLIVLAALTVSLAIPIVGILLVSALIVLPVVTALQFKKSFKQTILIAEVISIVSVFLGIFVSYYLNLATGGTIVLIALGIFFLSLFF